MTTTHFAFAPVTSRWVCLLPLSIAAMSAACGTSPSMVGESAGGPGASAGNAGASSTSGGSDTGSGGSGTASGGSTGHAGASGSTASGGGSNTGGSNTGGSNTGGSSSGGVGGSGGTSCVTDTDCGAGFDCLYKIADGCAAKGACFKAPGGAVCASLTPYCGCSGQVVDVPCFEPTGYSPAPVSGQQSSATCPATPDAACAGKSCGAGCSTGEVPAICDANGKCITGGVPMCPATP